MVALVKSLIIVLLAAILLPVSFGVADDVPVEVKVIDRNSLEEEILEMKKIFGEAMSEDKQPFENVVNRLLLISLDDIERGRGKSDLNMALREKYFTPFGWQAYRNYERTHKSILEEKKSQYGYVHPQVRARFVYGSQVYTEYGNEQLFKAEGHFLYASGCLYEYQGDDFDLTVSVTGGFDNPEGMKIEGWKVNFIKKDE